MMRTKQELAEKVWESGGPPRSRPGPTALVAGTHRSSWRQIQTVRSRAILTKPESVSITPRGRQHMTAPRSAPKEGSDGSATRQKPWRRAGERPIGVDEVNSQN